MNASRLRSIACRAPAVARPRRFKTCAAAALAAATLMLGDAAYGARLVLMPLGNTVLSCRVRLVTRDGQVVPLPGAWQWVSHAPAVFDLRDLPPGIGGDSPTFGALSVSCWLADAVWPGDALAPDAQRPTFSVTLDREDAAWHTLDPITHQISRELPRDDHVVFFALERTLIPQRPIRIAQATLSRDLFSWLGYQVYGPWMHRYFVPDFADVPD